MEGNSQDEREEEESGRSDAPEESENIHKLNIKGAKEEKRCQMI